MQDAGGFEYQPKRGMSTGAKIGIGCGVVGLVVILICGGIFWYGMSWWSSVEQRVADFEAKGYVRSSGQMMDVSQPINAPTVFFAQTVTLRADANADIAFIGQALDVHGTIHGDLDFYGQVLTIHPEAVITGDVRVHGAQATDIQGTVHGQVVGAFRSPTKTTLPPGPNGMPSPGVGPPPADDSSE